MRNLASYGVFILCFFAIVQAHAQSFSGLDVNKRIGDSIPGVQTSLNKNWSSSFYRGISTGFGFFNGGNFMEISAPIGWQLNRRLTDNFYAFSGVSVAPAYVNFNRSFLYSDVSKSYPGAGIRSNNFGLYARAQAGLMYVNDARTFSISASLSAQRSSNPLLLYQPVTSARTSPGLPQNR